MQNQQISIIFDMDGVLIDTSDNVHALKTVLATHGVDLNAIHDPHGQQWRGGSLAAMTLAIQSQFGVTIDVDELASRADDIHYERMKSSNTVAHPHLRRFLDELSSSKTSVGLGSASRNGRIHSILSRLDILHYFDAIVGADDVQEHKPHPSVYTEVAHRLGSTARNCIVIEDTAAGVEAGKRAGMTVIGFSKFQEQADALAAADYLVQDYDELAYSLVSSLIPRGSQLLS